jgi:hypothetical protein
MYYQLSSMAQVSQAVAVFSKTFDSEIHTDHQQKSHCHESRPPLSLQMAMYNLWMTLQQRKLHEQHPVRQVKQDDKLATHPHEKLHPFTYSPVAQAGFPITPKVCGAWLILPVSTAVCHHPSCMVDHPHQNQSWHIP